jgi:hypothetical protein
MADLGLAAKVRPVLVLSLKNALGHAEDLLQP